VGDCQARLVWQKTEGLFFHCRFSQKENAQNGLSTTNEFGLVLMMDFYKRGGRLCGQDLASLGKIREDR
jgi:hypothetical protein